MWYDSYKQNIYFRSSPVVTFLCSHPHIHTHLGIHHNTSLHSVQFAKIPCVFETGNILLVYTNSVIILMIVSDNN